MNKRKINKVVENIHFELVQDIENDIDLIVESLIIVDPDYDINFDMLKEDLYLQVIGYYKGIFKKKLQEFLEKEESEILTNKEKDDCLRCFSIDIEFSLNSRISKFQNNFRNTNSDFVQ